MASEWVKVKKPSDGSDDDSLSMEASSAGRSSTKSFHEAGR